MQAFLLRTLDLARRGCVAVQPNPQVGAVLVHSGRIIAEGWHQRYGGPHAEVNCLQQVNDTVLLQDSTLYVSLEPCSHHGKTPPCANLIVEKGIPRVIIGCLDPNPEVAGGGIAHLRRAGVEVLLGDNARLFETLIAHFRVNILRQRPFVTLKWAQTPAGVIGRRSQRLHLSGPEALALGHALRAQHAAVLIGTETALRDDPLLTTRHFPGASPVRVVLDRRARLPETLRIFRDAAAPTWVLSESLLPPGSPPHVRRLRPPGWKVSDILAWLYAEHRIGSLLVEGGGDTLSRFLTSGLWDDLIVLTREDAHFVGADAVQAPALPATIPPLAVRLLGPDRLTYYQRP